MIISAELNKLTPQKLLLRYFIVCDLSNYDLCEIANYYDKSDKLMRDIANDLSFYGCVQEDTNLEIYKFQDEIMECLELRKIRERNEIK